MSGLNIISYNVRGLNSPIKCANIVGELKFLKPEVVLLQETHLFLGKSQRILSRDYPTWFYGESPTRGAKGVAIGFAKDVRFTLEERMTDPEGRFLFLSLPFNGFDCSLANVYGPNNNNNPSMYLLGILLKFEAFKKGGPS